MSARERTLAFVAWIVVCIVWGTTYLGIRVALESVPVALVGGLRWTAAGLLLTAVLVGRSVLTGRSNEGLLDRSHDRPRQMLVQMLGPIAIVAFLMNVVGNGLVVWAQQYVASGLAAVVVAMVPFWSVGVEGVLPRGERISARVLAGLVIGLLGIIVLMWPELTMGGQDGRLFVAGVIALQIACLGWALGTSYTKRHSMGANPIGASALQMLIGGLMLLAIGTAFGEWSRLAFTPRTAAAMAYLVIFGSLVGYSAYIYAIKHLPISTVSLYAYVNPVIAVVLGTLLLDEPFSARIVLAAGLVFAGIAVVRSKQAHASTSLSAPLRKAAA